jgi:membrane-associated phospholipid phosphatase
MFIAISAEITDDIGRGFFSQHGTLQGVQNARNVVAFEAAHGFWVEPAWQTFFQHTHRLFLWTLTWPDAERLMNGIYIGGHVFVTLAVALWVYFYRRSFFPFWRNILILANVIALFVYESFPVAPPRLTTNLTFNHHVFTFQDTMSGIISSGRNFVGTQASGYNEFSAMPSIHMAWALMAGLALVVLARPLWAKALGILYPFLMLISVVVTGNHFILDGVGSALVLTLAAPLAFAFECWRGRMEWPLWLVRRRRTMVAH